jgi:hypothetical protein
LYTKLDGTTTDVYSAGDRAFTGKTHMLNMKEDLVCNSLTKDLMFQLILFSTGNYTYNYMWSNMNADGNAPTRNQAVNAFDYWTPTNTTATRPAQDFLESTLILSQIDI